jgi:DNA-binding CsgD family transcriptional regulator
MQAVLEAQAARPMALGLSHAQIGKRLFISVETVKTHRYRAFRQLGVSSRTQPFWL